MGVQKYVATSDEDTIPVSSNQVTLIYENGVNNKYALVFLPAPS